MKTQRNALMQLGKRVAKDLSEGRMSSGMRSLGKSPSAAADTLPTLLDLLLAEARKKGSSETLIAAYLFMMREALQVIRIRLETGEAEAEAIIGFRRMGCLQKFSAAHASIHNHFNQERHLISRADFKRNRTAALAEWRQLGSP